MLSLFVVSLELKKPLQKTDSPFDFSSAKSLNELQSIKNTN